MPGSGLDRFLADSKQTRLKQYKARVERPWDGCHAMELWLVAPNILTAGRYLLEKLSLLDVDESQVTQLIEINKGDDLWLCASPGQIALVMDVLAMISVLSDRGTGRARPR